MYFRLKKSVYPFYRQPDTMECGSTCLRMVAKYYGKEYSLKTIQQLCTVSHDGVSILSIREAAEGLGFQAVSGRMSLDNLLMERSFPCILYWNQKHFVVLYDIISQANGKIQFLVADPSKDLMKVEKNIFMQNWICSTAENEDFGILLLLQPTEIFYQKQDEPTSWAKSLYFLWQYISSYRSLFIQLIVGLILGSILQILFPFLTQAIVDKGIEGKNLHIIYLILIGQLVLVLSRTFVDFIRRWILLYISTRVNLSLLSDFFIKLVNLPMSFFDSKMTGDLLQRINDHQRVERFLTAQTLSTLFSVFSFVIFGGVLLYYNRLIFLIFILGSVIYAGWITLFLQKRRLLDYTYFEQRVRNQNKTMQLLTGMQEVKLQGCENRRRWEWEDTQADLFETNIISMKLQQSQEIGNILINEIKNIIITIVAATSVINGSLSLGMMLAIQYIIGQLNGPIDQFVQFVYNWQDVQICLERMNDIRQRDDEEKNRSIIPDFNDRPKDIRLTNLTFQYEGKNSQKVLDKINLVIPAGKITAIVGNSGSGKTTLIKLLLGYYNPIEGDILIGTDSLQKLSLSWWRKQCGAVMQDGFIFSESIAQNIAECDDEINEERLLLSAHIACVDEFVQKLPLKYNTMIGLDGQGISQGQKQRILIARSVYKNPSFLFFDEATNSLDAINERAIVDNLTDFYKGKTVLIVAHRLSTVRNADQIVVLDYGRIQETGNHETLIAKRGAYYHLVKNQLELGS